MSQLELFYWSQQWISNNLPPLPLVKFESPSYHPYEIDPSHYTNWDDYIDLESDMSHDYYYEEYFSDSDSELDSDIDFT